MPCLNKMDFCTLLVAVDDFFINKLLSTFPTWLLCHPEILNMNILIMYDANGDRPIKGSDPRFKELGKIWNDYRRYHGRGKAFYAHVVPWSMPEAGSQRERMLTSLVHASAHITTPWYLKLDADTYATEPKGFYYDKWFNQNPAFIGNHWGYTKPGTALQTLNIWAKTVEELKDFPPVEGKIVARDGNPTWKVNHHRMCSWVFFGNTSWCQETLGYLDGLKLPFPSQDTYFSFIATLTGRHFLANKETNFRRYGWEHCRNEAGLKAACTKTITEHRRKK